MMMRLAVCAALLGLAWAASAQPSVPAATTPNVSTPPTAATPPTVSTGRGTTLRGSGSSGPQSAILPPSVPGQPRAERAPEASAGAGARQDTPQSRGDTLSRDRPDTRTR